MFIRYTSSILLLLSTAGCIATEAAPQEGDGAATSAESGGQEDRRERFVDARSYLSAPADIDAWYALMSALKSDFDSVCGDSFCEGDYANYESLGFHCSVEEQAGTIGKCVWIFAASNEEIAPSTGNVDVHARTWRCTMPLSPDTPIRDFVQALSAPSGQPIYATLPEMDRSLYDGLVDCL